MSLWHAMTDSDSRKKREAREWMRGFSSYIKHLSQRDDTILTWTWSSIHSKYTHSILWPRSSSPTLTISLTMRFKVTSVFFSSHSSLFTLLFLLILLVGGQSASITVDSDNDPFGPMIASINMERPFGHKNHSLLARSRRSKPFRNYCSCELRWLLVSLSL